MILKVEKLEMELGKVSRKRLVINISDPNCSHDRKDLVEVKGKKKDYIICERCEMVFAVKEK